MPKITNSQLVALVGTYWRWKWLWITTTVAFGGIGLFFVLFLKSDMWLASQGIIVRDEANGAVMRLGRFESQTEMKAAQETILEMARNAQVLGDALAAVGRERSWFSTHANDEPPTIAEIEELARNGVEVRAPRGAELGTTEVIYLDVKQKSRSRCLELNKAVCDSLERRLQLVRQARADGVISELTTAKMAAQQKLDEVTQQLKQIEAEAGADLSDLRGLTDASTGGSTNRQLLDTIKAELRQAELQLQQLQTDLQLAIESFENPDQLLLTPGELINKQPGVKALREGLAAASIATSRLQGRYTATHPLVEASKQSEVKIRDQLRIELGLAVQSLQKDAEIADERVSKLKQQQRQLESRLENIARIRADYANLASEVSSRSVQLQEAERELAEAEASRNAALTSSLITRIDEPLIGEKPLGPSRLTILAGATISGLFFGLGIVFLLNPLDAGIKYGRRRFDYSPATGRRSSDTPSDASGSPQTSSAVDSKQASANPPAEFTVPDPREAAEFAERGTDTFGTSMPPRPETTGGAGQVDGGEDEAQPRRADTRVARTTPRAAEQNEIADDAESPNQSKSSGSTAAPLPLPIQFSQEANATPTPRL